MAVDLDLDRRWQPTAMAWAPIGMQDRAMPLVVSVAKVVQALVEGADAAVAQVDLDHQARPQL